MASIQDESVYCSPLYVDSLDALAVEDDDGNFVPIEIKDPSQDPEAQYSRTEMAAAISTFISSLLLREQGIVYRVYWTGETQASVARSLGISDAAVSKILKKVHDRGHNVLSNWQRLAFEA